MLFDILEFAVNLNINKMAKNKGNTMAQTAYTGVYNSLRILVHLTAAVQFSYSIYYDYTYVHFPVSDKNMHNPFGGKFKYLTFLDAVCFRYFFLLNLNLYLKAGESLT